MVSHVEPLLAISVLPGSLTTFSFKFALAADLFGINGGVSGASRNDDHHATHHLQHHPPLSVHHCITHNIRPGPCAQALQIIPRCSPQPRRAPADRLLSGARALRLGGDPPRADRTPPPFPAGTSRTNLHAPRDSSQKLEDRLLASPWGTQSQANSLVAVSQCRVAPTSTVTEVGQNNPKGLLESADKREKSNYGKRAVERTVWTRPGEVSFAALILLARRAWRFAWCLRA